MNKFTSEEFYPTPLHLLEKITAGIDWTKVKAVLEPSAGKADMAEYVAEAYSKAMWRQELDIDCIELDGDLRCTLKGKGYKVVHDDFLTYKTFKKYDLIIMNPPFSNGASHLMKALDMQKDGGAVVCILNAETLRNPCTNERKALVQRLDELDASIEYMENEFTSAERPTGVEIAVIRVHIEEMESESFIFEGLKKKTYAENTYQNINELAPNDFIEAIVQQYNLEVEAGVKLIQEYRAMRPYLMDSINPDDAYKNPILELRLHDKNELSVNKFVREVRKKYWNALFKNKKFTGNMTSNLAQEYHDKVRELANYDFSLYNIKTLQVEMTKNLIKGIEDCIVELFDQLSYQYAYSDELGRNIHYYNGWKTNKAWYINKKVILPYMNAFSSWSGRFEPDYNVRSKLMDIEKALNYLDGGLTIGRNMDSFLNYAKEIGQTKNIELKYFYVTFYKKGTCHIEFKDEDLLKKLNIFGSQQKAWLPPAYGKKKYSEMEPEEKAVIDEFEGEMAYHKTLARADYFIYEPKNSMPMLEAM